MKINRRKCVLIAAEAKSRLRELFTRVYIALVCPMMQMMQKSLSHVIAYPIASNLLPFYQEIIMQVSGEHHSDLKHSQCLTVHD